MIMIRSSEPEWFRQEQGPITWAGTRTTWARAAEDDAVAVVRASRLSNASVVAVDHRTTFSPGTVETLLFDPGRWIVRYLVVRRASDEARILLPPVLLDWDQSEDAWIWQGPAGLLATAPAFDGAASISRRIEARVHNHFGCPGYWELEGEDTLFIESDQPPGQSLRSPGLIAFEELRRMELGAYGCAVGMLRDLLLDSATWLARFMSVGLRARQGVNVLIAPDWRTVDCSDGSITVNLPEQVIHEAPRSKRGRPLRRGGERRIFEHCGTRPYWSV